MSLLTKQVLGFQSCILLLRRRTVSEDGVRICKWPLETSAGQSELVTLSTLTHTDSHTAWTGGPVSIFFPSLSPSPSVFVCSGLVTLQFLGLKKLRPHCHLTQ